MPKCDSPLLLILVFLQPSEIAFSCVTAGACDHRFRRGGNLLPSVDEDRILFGAEAFFTKQFAESILHVFLAIGTARVQKMRAFPQHVKVGSGCSVMLGVGIEGAASAVLHSRHEARVKCFDALVVRMRAARLLYDHVVKGVPVGGRAVKIDAAHEVAVAVCGVFGVDYAVALHKVEKLVIVSRRVSAKHVDAAAVAHFGAMVSLLVLQKAKQLFTQRPTMVVI